MQSSQGQARTVRIWRRSSSSRRGGWGSRLPLKWERGLITSLLDLLRTLWETRWTQLTRFIILRISGGQRATRNRLNMGITVSTCTTGLTVLSKLQWRTVQWPQWHLQIFFTRKVGRDLDHLSVSFFLHNPLGLKYSDIRQKFEYPGPGTYIVKDSLVHPKCKQTKFGSDGRKAKFLDNGSSSPGPARYKQKPMIGKDTMNGDMRYSQKEKYNSTLGKRNNSVFAMSGQKNILRQ